MKVFACINEVMKCLAKKGISKDKTNNTQGYKFRGIDDVYNTLSSLLAEHGLVIYPIVKSRCQEERKTSKGGVLFFTAVNVDYNVVAVEDGSSFTMYVYGEAMDSGDKSTNKAMSAAYKYMCLQLFCIPTEGDNDPDASTPDPVLPKQTPIQQPAPSKQTPEQQYAALLQIKGLYSEELVNQFKMMPLEQKRAEYERVKGA